jgi:hypothetical protein
MGRSKTSINWSEEKVSCVRLAQRVWSTTERVEEARQALRDAGYAEDANNLNLAKLRTAYEKLSPREKAKIFFCFPLRDISHDVACWLCFELTVCSGCHSGLSQGRTPEERVQFRRRGGIA